MIKHPSPFHIWPQASQLLWIYVDNSPNSCETFATRTHFHTPTNEICVIESTAAGGTHLMEFAMSSVLLLN